MHHYSCRQRCQMAQSIAEAFLAHRQLNDFLQQNGFVSFDSFVQEYRRLNVIADAYVYLRKGEGEKGEKANG